MNKSETKLVDPFDVKPPLQQSDVEHVSDCLTKNFSSINQSLYFYVIFDVKSEELESI